MEPSWWESYLPEPEGWGEFPSVLEGAPLGSGDEVALVAKAFVAKETEELERLEQCVCVACDQGVAISTWGGGGDTIVHVADVDRREPG